MKQLTAALLFFAVACPLSVFAAEPVKTAQPPMQHEGGMAGMQHGGGMMHGMGMMDDQHIQTMQAHILKMHDLSNQILAEKDPAKQVQQTDNTELSLSSFLNVSPRYGMCNWG